MDPVTLSALMAGGGMLANLFAGQQAAKRSREEMNLVNKQIADLTAWKNNQVYQPYMDSNLGRSVWTRAMDKYRENAQTAKSTAAVTGASNEAVTAQKAGAEAALGNVASDIAAQGTARADAVESRYQSNLANLMAQKLGLLQGRTQAATNLGSTAGAFMQSLTPTFAAKTAPVAPTAAPAAPVAGVPDYENPNILQQSLAGVVSAGK